MTAFSGLPDDSSHLATAGHGLDGVVRITSAGHYGTGALLYDGLHILTAAHLANGASAGSIAINFETSSGLVTRHATAAATYPGYSATQSDGDLALLELDAPAPVDAERYQLYRDNDEIGKSFTLAGYGEGINGTNGLVSSTGARRFGENRFDTTMDVLDKAAQLTWHPVGNKQLVADFDNGTAAYDTLGSTLGIRDFGRGSTEALSTLGDSGGPAFVDGKIAGVASYAFTVSSFNRPLDTDGIVNGTLGELASWMRVSAYAQWIDQTMHADWRHAPHQPSEVVTSIPEGAAGTITTAWLLLSLPSATVAACSVVYRTVDGTATAGTDYLAATGRAVIWPGEASVAIPVEIIGNSTPEANKTFFLEVSDPIGAGFANGATSLKAMRTILDDDTPIAKLAGIAKIPIGDQLGF